MEVKLDIPFQQLLNLIQQLNPVQRRRVQDMLTKGAEPVNGPNKDLATLLLNGPVFPKEQLKRMERTRLAFEQWRAA
ncbi:MAG: hypothetical protein ACOH13_06460 [Flavobacteriales bacterium]